MAKILLVEDDPMIAEIYIKKMESAGFDVVNAVTGKEVLKYASEDKFDLVLLDMVLPEMSGMDALKELRNGNYDKDLKIVIFSNLSENEVQKEAVENGADGFIGKTDYSPSELIEVVKHKLAEFEEQRKNKERNGENNQKNGKKILFIEDEEIFLEMFGKKIESAGFEVEYAKNGAWGIKKAMEEDYDLIVTDMVMPAMNGDEIVKRLKSEQKTKDIPIIVISASVSDDQLKKVEEYGVADYFVKTRIVPSDLSRRIEEILS